MAELTDKELRVLAYTLLGEAGGEGKAGMEAVMNVIMNRAESGRYSSNPAAVAVQANSKGVHQFSTWNTKGAGGNSPSAKFGSNSAEFSEALDIVQAAMAGNLEDTTGGATHFVTKKMFEDAKPYWWGSEAPEGEVTIGNHVFGARNPNNALTAIRNAVTPANRPGNRGGVDAMGYGASGVRPPPTVGQDTAIPRPTAELKSRSVQTVDINSSTGMPYERLPTEEPMTPLERAYVQKLDQAPMRDVDTPLNAQDDSGEAARSTFSNAASSGKTARYRSPDYVGDDALISANSASADKVARARPPASVSVQASGRTIQQIEQEADNARLSGYRDIQEAGPSSKGAPVKPAATTARPSGTIKTAGTVTSTGTRLPLAGSNEQPIPKPSSIKPVTVFAKPRPLTIAEVQSSPKFNSAQKEASRMGAVFYSEDPAKKLPTTAQITTLVKTPTKGSAPMVTKGNVKKATTITQAQPLTEAELSVVTAKPKGPVMRRTPAQVQRYAQRQTGAIPMVGKIAQRVAQQMLTQVRNDNNIPATGAYTSTSWQEDRFQITENSLLPKSTNNSRWLTGY